MKGFDVQIHVVYRFIDIEDRKIGMSGAALYPYYFIGTKQTILRAIS
jgi:hypothetical protein